MNPSPSPQQVSIDPGYPRLRSHLVEITGLAYYLQRDDELATRLAERMSILQLPSCQAYFDRLLSGPAGEAELDLLIAELTIGETFFFRHREQFDAVRDRIVPELIRKNRATRQLRIWSAGCAVGAEPYSLAILLQQHFRVELAGWDVSILGTDINRQFLAQAGRGEFGEWAFRTAPEELRTTCFSPQGKLWTIHPEFKRQVSFQYHNLVRHPFPSLVNNLSAFDLILCRNVMIYFSPDIIRRLLGQFHATLADGGWLLVGHAEPNIEWFGAYRTVNAPGTVLYQKASASDAATAGVMSPFEAAFDSSPLDSSSRIATASLDWPVWPAAPDVNSQPTPAYAPLTALPPQPISAPSPMSTPLSAAPDCAAALPTLADIRREADAGRWPEAERHCHELLAREGLNPLIHLYHALILEQRGLHTEGERALRRAIYLDRSFVLAHYYLALLLQRKHDPRGAQRSFRNVVRLLDGADPAREYPEADGLTAAELAGLARMHLNVLEGCAES